MIERLDDFGGGGDTANTRTAWSHDGAGRRTSISDHDNNTTRYVYDSAGRLWKAHYPDHPETDPRGTVVFGYDAAGNTTSRLDQNQRTTDYVYDDLHRLVRRIYGLGGPFERSEWFDYDRSGRMTVAEGGTAATVVNMEYDGVGRLKRARQTFYDAPVGQYEVAYAYTVGPTPAGDPRATRTITYPTGRSVVETYDGRQRLIGTSGGPAIGATWLYDLADRRTRTQLANGFEMQYGRNPNGSINATTLYGPIGPAMLAITNGLNAEGDPVWTQHLPQMGRRDSISPLDRLRRLYCLVTGCAIDVSDPNDPHFPQGQLCFDVVGLATNICYPRDRRGNLLAWEETDEPIIPLGLKEWVNGANEIDQIDLDGNPQGGPPPVALIWSETGGLLYDPLGRILGNDPPAPPAGHSYAYDEENRLTRVYRGAEADPNDLLLAIGYDALGRRVESRAYSDGVNSAVTHTRHVFTGFTVAAEYDVSSHYVPVVTLAREFVWGDRFPEPVALIDWTSAGQEPAGQPEAFHYTLDRLGSVLALSDAGGPGQNPPGALVEQYFYTPHGQTFLRSRVEVAPGQWGWTLWQRGAASAVGNPYLWTGQRYDAGVRLYHFLHRTFNPGLGRWLQRDPLGYVDGVNLYEYVAGRPLSAVDPTGESMLTFILGLGWDPGPEIEQGVRDEFDRSNHDRSLGAGDAAVGAATGGLVENVGGAAFDEARRDQARGDAGVALLPIEYANPAAKAGTALRVAKGVQASVKAAKGAAALNRAKSLVIRNKHLAGKKHGVTGVPFDKDGFPVFGKHVKKRVTIKQTGEHMVDVLAANKAAGYKETPKGYSWHHHQDGQTMELVPTDLHSKTAHTGGAAIVRQR